MAASFQTCLDEQTAQDVHPLGYLLSPSIGLGIVDDEDKFQTHLRQRGISPTRFHKQFDLRPKESGCVGVELRLRSIPNTSLQRCGRPTLSPHIAKPQRSTAWPQAAG